MKRLLVLGCLVLTGCGSADNIETTPLPTPIPSETSIPKPMPAASIPLSSPTPIQSYAPQPAPTVTVTSLPVPAPTVTVTSLPIPTPTPTPTPAPVPPSVLMNKTIYDDGGSPVEMSNTTFTWINYSVYPTCSFMGSWKDLNSGNISGQVQFTVTSSSCVDFQVDNTYTYTYYDNYGQYDLSL